MARMKPPIVPDQPVPVIPEDALRRLLHNCADKDFESRRDAGIMLLLDTGLRREALAGIQLDDWTPTSRSSGSSTRAGSSVRCRSGSGPRRPWTAYLRVRARHKDAALPWLWLGLKGRLTKWGIVITLRRRGEEVGVPDLHPHQFRHTFAHQWLADGGGETDLMRLAGWRSRIMLQRYGASPSLP
jgi:integrase